MQRFFYRTDIPYSDKSLKAYRLQQFETSEWFVSTNLKPTMDCWLYCDLCQVV